MNPHQRCIQAKVKNRNEPNDMITYIIIFFRHIATMDSAGPMHLSVLCCGAVKLAEPLSGNATNTSTRRASLAAIAAIAGLPIPSKPVIKSMSGIVLSLVFATYMLFELHLVHIWRNYDILLFLLMILNIFLKMI